MEQTAAKPDPDPSVSRFWSAFLATLVPDSELHHRAWNVDRFGDSPQMADQLGGLIAAGIKTATCSALWEWEAHGEAIPAPGRLAVVVDGRGQPLCVIETTTIELRTFEQVDEAFAREEGEGDRSLADWRAGHWAYFERNLPAFGRQVALDIPLVCERFRLLYPSAPGRGVST